MASYTMLLKTYIEKWSQYETLSTREKIEVGRTKLFDFDYPIFDETYRKVFETHFIRNFYFREIGSETEGKWKFDLETWLIINMPYFNKMFESELIEFDPLKNSAVDVTHNKTNDKTQNDIKNSTGTASSSSTQDNTSETIDDGFNRHVEAETPDSRLNLTTNDGEGILEYASEIDEDTSNNTQNVTANTTGSADSNSTIDDTLSSDVNEIEDFIQHRAGKIGVQTYSKMIEEYRHQLLRLEKTIFNEMNELFMLVY